jgi:hypothetical protein
MIQRHPPQSTAISGVRLLFVVSALSLASAGILAMVATESCRFSQATCAVCGREECRALTFRVAYTDGVSVETCCARCASHAVAAEKTRRVASLVATDFATGLKLDAREALYVEGSDYEHCHAPGVKPTSSGCCLEMDFDRCLPSLVAFKTAKAARSFISLHGGSLREFGDLHFGEPPRRGGK